MSKRVVVREMSTAFEKMRRIAGNRPRFRLPSDSRLTRLPLIGYFKSRINRVWPPSLPHIRSRLSGRRLEEFNHFNDQGHVHMVDVSSKSLSNRTATASCEVYMQAQTLTRIKNNGFEKGNVIEVARLAGIMATKRTSDIIPLCHPLRIDGVDVGFQFVSDREIRITASVKTNDRTGVEMEALMAVSSAGLVVYDMCKSIDRSMKITNVQLEEKTGGKSGDFRRA